ncbi:MAG: hypothetical protein JWM04_2752 [Verrucomicrobiales bacterium]|nr:hypothetical protein [Verrucomicrobiales bacterium]
MKRLILVTGFLFMVGIVWRQQHAESKVMAAANARLVKLADQLEKSKVEPVAEFETNHQKLLDLRKQLEVQESNLARDRQSRTQPVTNSFPLPEPERMGGWPKGFEFIYFPKSFLTNVSYALLAGDKLTPEAIALLGLSETEKQSVNRSFADLLGRYRQLEAQQMRPVDPPSTWGNGQFDTALTYRIPDLTSNLEAGRREFSASLQQSLGDARAQLVEEAAQNHIRKYTDDLGGGERVVGFLWQPESDGTHSLWYGISNTKKNQGGSFQRVPDHVDANSQMAYYARLLGVKLPGQH